MRKSASMATLEHLSQPVDDLLQLAKESLRLFSELRRSGVPVSPTTSHALLNEATLAIEAIRTTVSSPEAPSDTLARLAPWAQIVIPATPWPPTPVPSPEAPPSKRTRRTKAEMDADAKKTAEDPLPPLALKEDRTPAQLAADGDGPAVAIAITNPMPVESAQIVSAQQAAAITVAWVSPEAAAGMQEVKDAVQESVQPGFDREKAEAVLKKTGDEFRASEEKRREREALAATRPVPVEAAAAAVSPASTAGPYPPSSPEWKAKLHLAPLPEDAALPFKNGDYANKRLSECSIRDLEIVLYNYVRGFESETDPEKRSQRALWLERGAAWHRYRFDLLLLNAGDADMQELRAEYATKASAPGPSPAMQMHRKLWLERIEEIDKARKENEGGA
jgi:hypothetical protein